MLHTEKEYQEIKRKLFIAEAKRWARLEQEGLNDDKRLLGCFDKSAKNRNWTTDFVMECLQSADDTFEFVFGDSCEKHQVVFADEVGNMWEENDVRNRRRRPQAGDIAIWAHMRHGRRLASGHLGIITECDKHGSQMTMIEGTNVTHFDARKFDKPGIYTRERDLRNLNGLALLGFISPWR